MRRLPKIPALGLLALFLGFFAFPAAAATYYVDINSPNPTPPYTNWNTASTDIQSAINLTTNGDLVLVNDGVYETGGETENGYNLTNRVVLDRSITVQSANGPLATVIAGLPAIGDSAVRCAYVTNGAMLAGFTLTNGATLNDGDGIYEQSGGGVLCESAAAVLSNCVVSASSSTYYGGGVYQGTLDNCTLAGNSAGYAGGGGYGGTYYNCVFSNNFSGWLGGGMDSALACDCVFSNNVAYYGGGAENSTLATCSLTGNYTLVDEDATANGGGASGCTLTNCLLSGNSSLTGGGASGSTLVNCTVTCNSAGDDDGGVGSCTLTNCIVYFNTAPSGTNYSDDSVLSYCDTTPLAACGVNNLANDPLFADSLHISAASPCRGAGLFSATSGVDIDGDAWLNPPSIGCDEFNSASATGALVVAISETFTNVASGLVVDFSAQISGHATANLWNFGDGTVVSNELAFSHSWSAPGNYTVTFTAFNSDNPAGVGASVEIFVLASPVHYVALGNPVPVPPYLSWATAATNLQDAVDAAFAGGTLIVSNGIYQTGGRIVSGVQSNRVAVTKPLLIRSVNGPAFTTIQGNSGPGDSAVRCAYLTNRCTLTGFTLNGGATHTVGNDSDLDGGGAWCGDANTVISNCVFTGNSAVNGGGVFQGTLLNCWFFANQAGGSGGGANSATLCNSAIEDNSAGGSGGGVENCALVNSTLTRNYAAGSGGGADNATLANCLVYFNTAPDQPNDAGGSLNFCCATPLPGSGTNNITADPQMADAAHIASNSPCLGAGSPNYSIGVDIDGDAWRNPPSIGCDEFYPGAATGALSVAIQSDYTNFAPDFAVNFYEMIFGRASSSCWDFGDGVSVTNQFLVSHSWSVPGNYTVTFTAFNDDHPGGVSATMTVYVASDSVHYVSLASTNPVAPFLAWDTAATNIQDAVDAACVPGALILVTNGVYQTGSRIVANGETNRVAVTRLVTVASVNGAAATVIDGAGALRCIYLTNGATLQGFTLTNGFIAGDGGGAWCAFGAMVLDCVLANNSAGDSGGGVFGGSLSNCTLTGNSAGNSGGGVFGSSLSNCGLTGNSAYNGSGAESAILDNCVVIGNSSSSVFFCSGGGVDNCTAANCLINGNTSWYGAGANSSTLNNCTLTGNTPQSGDGAAANSTLNNCISYYNIYSDYDGNCTLNYCCTEGNPGGIGNLTAAPVFVNEPYYPNQGGGDYRLQSNSPCINAGNNAGVTVTTDLDRNPRIVGGTVDMGAYEYQTPTSVISYVWLQQYGLPTDGSVDYTNLDGTAFNVYQDWIAGLNPTNSASVLAMLTPTATNNANGITVTWQSVSGISYNLLRSTNLPAFTTLQPNIAGQTNTTSYTDTSATNNFSYFYRVSVLAP
jgi:hypothetical protein